MLLLYICNLYESEKINLNVTYASDFNKECYSPSCMKEDELIKLSGLEHKLIKDEINSLSNEWKTISKENSELRIMNNEKVLSTTYDYFNDIILNELKRLGEVKISKVVGSLMIDYHLRDTVFAYLIKRLIKLNTIKITKQSNERFFQNYIKAR